MLVCHAQFKALRYLQAKQSYFIILSNQSLLDLRHNKPQPTLPCPTFPHNPVPPPYPHASPPSRSRTPASPPTTRSASSRFRAPSASNTPGRRPSSATQLGLTGDNLLPRRHRRHAPGRSRSAGRPFPGDRPCRDGPRQRQRGERREGEEKVERERARERDSDREK